MKLNENVEGKLGYCIYINTLCEGPVPIERNEKGMPVVYFQLVEAQRSIAEDVIERLRQFLEGYRDFEDAMTVEEYIQKVRVFADGSILDENGARFGKRG